MVAQDFAKYDTASRFPSALTFLSEEAYDGNGFSPRALVELEITAMQGSMREKPEWWRKVLDPEITQKWRREIMETPSAMGTETGHDEQDLTIRERQFDFALAECQWLANQYESEPTRPAAVDGVFCRDDLPDDEDGLLHQELLQEISRLRAKPAIGSDKEDRHPGTPNMVDLVHPSLYAYERGKTQVLPGLGAEALSMPEWSTFVGSEGVAEEPRGQEDGKALLHVHAPYSKAGLQWLPSEFCVNGDASKCEIKSYINSLHPEHDAKLYDLIGKLFCRAVPAFEAVLRELGEHNSQDHRDSVRERLPRVPIVDDWWQGEQRDQEEGESDSDYWNYVDEFYETGRTFVHPDIPDFEAPPSYNKDAADVTLRDCPLQVITKIASLELGPGEVFGGGSWHVEGTLEERIVATACCYLECTNVEGGELSFRTSVCEPGYEQSDDDGVRQMYGLENEAPLVQDIGRCETKQGRMLVWPNTLHHRVNRINLVDDKQAGKRTIVCFFLVDPGVRIRSTATVPPQPLAWVSEVADSVLESRLVSEKAVLHQISNMNLASSSLLTYEAACERRERLMDERRQSVTGSDGELFFERIFSLCEH